MSLVEAGREHDHFFLNHLQSIKSDADNYYQNQRFVGKGGNGTTFLVTCTSGSNQGMQFALKVFHKVSDQRRRERFLEEVKHYRQLSHPAIVNVYDEGTFSANGKSYPFAVIDFASSNLQKVLLKAGARVSRLEAVRYIYNVASGVSFLHSQPNPIVHRDIKPANILVDGMSAKLGDLGLVKVLMSDDQGDEDPAEIAGYAAMPSFYRTPELVRIANDEDVELTPASDIYQLGLVFYQAVTGFNPQLPPKADSGKKGPIELDVRDVFGAASDRINNLVGNMLNEDPMKRPESSTVLDQLNLIHKELCSDHLYATGVQL